MNVAVIGVRIKPKYTDEKILSNANCLLSYAEVISREAILISEDERKLYSIPKSNIEMWRTGFLICWAKGLPNLKIPNEIIAFDKGFDKENEALIKQLVTLDQNTLFHEGWFNTNACRAPKLSALIDGYVQEEKLVASKNNRNFSTGNIAKYIKKNFEIVNPNDSDEENFVKKLSEVATIEPKGISLKKKSPKQNN
ncbi:hypothetical protein [Legionella yabuuchiae]|uniref:hypothetical protein n=1 Tax=Legionella yabuuchiae TaxID=376727 RepID=UPI0010555189|nr:hypothetical protein [Legionella yabuuchiae]